MLLRFQVNQELLVQTRVALAGRDALYWLVGGAGAGKSTLCAALSARFGIPIYDMDARVYGSYHARFDSTRHPVNTAWSTAPDALAWLLTLSWDEFHDFNQAALPEYLDLLGEDLAAMPPGEKILIDGGICNPGLLAQVIPARQIVCLAAPAQSSAAIWAATDERQGMKEAIDQLPNAQAMWRTFLDFDSRITRTMLEECQQQGIAICLRDETTSVAALVERVAGLLGIE
ncbi:MAG: hypothetical protein KAX65_09880 [Caldilineaceae bacterium]|nr:hypothetical protein [Caldilineaceae bacterium]